jgi:hypothetical protein
LNTNHSVESYNTTDNTTICGLAAPGPTTKCYYQSHTHKHTLFPSYAVFSQPFQHTTHMWLSQSIAIQSNPECYVQPSLR